MLKLLRKKGFAKKVIWVVAVIIIISFGFLGTAYLLSDTVGATYAGKIFGKKVPLDDFRDIYRDTEIFAKMRLGDRYYDLQGELNLLYPFRRWIV